MNSKKLYLDTYPAVVDDEPLNDYEKMGRSYRIVVHMDVVVVALLLQLHNPDNLQKRTCSRSITLLLCLRNGCSSRSCLLLAWVYG